MEKGKQNFLKGISRNVILLGFVSLLTDLSGQMVFPLLPLYLTSVLGAGAVGVGAVEGAAEAAASLLKVISGYWSDKIRKRKPFVFIGYLLSAVMKPVLAFAGSWPVVLLIRTFDRVGKGLRDAPRDALIAESSEEATRGKSFGFQRSLDGLGSVGGAVLAFTLLPLFGFQKLFILAIIPGVISVIVILFVREKNTLRPPSNQAGKPAATLVKGKILSRELKIFIFLSTIFALGNYNYAFLMLRAKDLGYNNTHTIMLYALFYLVYTFLSMYSGSLSDKFGRKPILVSGFIIFALVSLGLAIFPGKTALIIFFALFGLFFALIDGSQRAYIVDLSGPENKGTALGFFHTVVGIAALPGGLIAGMLWEKINPGATFLFGFSMALMSLIILVVFLHRQKHKNALS